MKGTIVAERYRCEDRLGRGGMGDVYAAIDLRTDRRVAVKLMLGYRLDRDDLRERFEREARVGARIDSPYLVEVLDAGVDAATGTPFLVMELLAGEDLERRLARLGPRPVEEVVAHLAQLARALARMAAARVVHRDLKPSNLFLQERRGEPARVKVLDLGVAKELAGTGDTTGLAGTPVYMAPEQIAGAAVSPATDVHALGLIAFTLLAGAPYWGKARDVEAIALAMKMKDGPIEPASARARALGAVVPPGFDAWFARCAARRPAQRFASAIAAARALAAALDVPAPAILDDAEEGAADGAEAYAHGGDEATEGSDATGAAPTAGTATGAPAMTATGAAPASPRRARGRWIGGATGLAIAGALVAAFARGPAATTGPLDRPGAILACPVLEVGDPRADGWLGAAAAALACERARVILGGLPARTRLPAELLDLPRQLQADFPADPFGAPSARADTLAAARRDADAYLDGAIDRRGPDFHVALVVRRRDRRAIATGEGTATSVLDAVRAAMAPLIAAGALPAARAIDPVIADHAGTSDPATLLADLDLQLAFKNNDGRLRCDDVARVQAGTGDHAQFVRFDCTSTFGLPTPPVVLTGMPTTTGAETTRARVEHMVHRVDDPAVIARLEARYRDESSLWGKSMIAATLSCLLQAGRRAESEDWAQRAVQHEPKNPTGEWCAPWDQLRTVAARPATMRAMQAWEPWHPYGWAADPDPAIRTAYAARAYALSPADTSIAGAYVDEFLAAGDPEGARSVALALAAAGAPAHTVGHRILLARIAASQTTFAAALAHARAAMQANADDAGWVRTQRIEAAALAVELAAILGRARPIADEAIDALARAKIAGTYVEESRWLATICAYASPDRAARCLGWLDVLQPGGPDDDANPAVAYVAGTRRWIAGDRPGAAAAWRPLVRTGDFGGLAEAMVVAFAAAGDHDVVAQLAGARGPGTYHGATLAMARAALAAAERGDRLEAARLAGEVVRAWSGADEKPPILDALRALADP